MPPRLGRGRINAASIAGVLNADAASDEEARSRVARVFGSVLALLFVLDMACAFAVLWFQCRDGGGVGGDNSSTADDADGITATTNLVEMMMLADDADDETSMGQCLKQSIWVHGFVFHPIMTGSDDEGGNYSHALGDLFLLSILRCIVTTGLLLIGIRFGRSSPKSPPTPPPTENSNNNTGEDVHRLLTEPLLSENGESPETFQDEEEIATDGEDRPAASPSRCCIVVPSDCKQRYFSMTPAQVKTLVLVMLFVTCTFYQVYAGLKVSTFDHPSSVVMIPLLCLTVLWINAEGYVFRTILSEMTRVNGLFLPPEVHRHPMYFVPSTGAMTLHHCDLCLQRIGGRDRRNGNNNNNKEEDGCYRCALCDFDVCMKCAKRNDAATVGENVLRGDRGVRAETALTTSGYIRRSIQVAKSELPLLLVSFLLLAASSLGKLLLPHYQGHIVDKVIPDPATGDYDKDGFYRFVKVYLILMVVQGAISTIYSAIFTLVSRRLKFTIRNALLERMLAQDIAYYDGTESGRLISRLTNDLDLMMSPIQSSLSSLLSNILILLGGMVMCFAKSYRLSMLAFVTVGPISYLWEQYALWSKGLAREMLSFWAEGNSIASQALSHIRTVKAFGCETSVLNKYSATNQEALNRGVKDAWGNGVTSALTGYLDLGSGVLILYYGGILVYNGELTVGQLVTFQLFWNMMNNAYQNLQGLITSFTRSAAGAEKVFSLWDSNPDIDPTQGDDVTWPIQGHIQLQQVNFYYQMRPDNMVLKNFQLDIPAGKTVALVGRSGGGKSTIINLLLRFYDPRQGSILLDGRRYDSLKVHQLRRLFGVVTQETELFALTVEENIAYGLDKDDYTMEDVIAAAKKAFAHDFICEMKDGYQTRIGERGNRLSGGQRQRLAIARVFLRRPKIILLDEATSALDENSQEAVQQALANLIAESNATVVLVAHRLSTVVNADSICVIDKGTVLEQGNHDELVAKGGIYASMVEKQLKKKADMLQDDEEEEEMAKQGDGDATKKKRGKSKDKSGAATSDDDIDALLSGD